MKRGEVWWVELDPAPDAEGHRPRPAVIVSNDAANIALNRVQVVPLTGSTGTLYPGEASVTIDGLASKAMADQMITTAKQRLRRPLGRLSRDDMRAVEKAIKIQLGMTL